MRVIDTFRRLWFSSRKLRFPIPRDALVLELGSGDSPCPRSDILLDLTLQNFERVGGKTVADRPLVLGVAEELPFKDRAFDYIIAFHVLEHSPSPVKFLSELQRVAGAGYIETPSYWWERVSPFTIHRLEVGLEPFENRTRLVIGHKKSPVPDAELRAQYLFASAQRSIEAQLSPFSLTTRYFWKEKIDYRILNPDIRIDWPSPRENSRETTADPRPPMRRFLKRVAQNLYRRGAVDLVPLLRCPDCKQAALAGGLARLDLSCPGCRRRFSFTDGIPNLHPRGWSLRSSAVPAD